MSSGNQQNYGMKVTEIVVGLSTVAAFSTIPYQQGMGIQSVAGGTCFYGGASLALGGSFGLPVATSLTQFPDYRGPVYFSAIGATATIRVLSFLSTT
jgi:hypothetical protein